MINDQGSQESNLSKVKKMLDSLRAEAHLLEQFVDELSGKPVALPEGISPEPTPPFAEFWGSLPDQLMQLRESLETQLKRLQSILS